jgi:hypothetical protein
MILEEDHRIKNQGKRETGKGRLCHNEDWQRDEMFPHKIVT